MGYKDAYCLEPSESVTDTLSSLNQWAGKYDSCTGIGSDKGKSGSSLAYDLITYADSCSSLDNSICTDSGASSSRRDAAQKSANYVAAETAAEGAPWETKVKYVAGGIFLLASFIMLTGILFTNRRRRRALMRRKIRQSKPRDERSRSKSKSRSKSRTREGEAGSTRKSSRSKSRSKSEKLNDTQKEDSGGVLA